MFVRGWWLGYYRLAVFWVQLLLRLSVIGLDVERRWFQLVWCFILGTLSRLLRSMHGISLPLGDVSVASVSALCLVILLRWTIADSSPRTCVSIGNCSKTTPWRSCRYIPIIRHNGYPYILLHQSRNLPSPRSKRKLARSPCLHLSLGRYSCSRVKTHPSHLLLTI